MTTNRYRIGRGADMAVVALALLAVAACSDDDDETSGSGASTTTVAGAATTVAAGEDVEAYCEAVLTIETFPDPDIDFETATPEEIGAALEAYEERLAPLADDVVAAAPEALADDVAVMAAAVDRIAESEEDPFAEPEVAAAQERVLTFNLANCGWEAVDVTASEYAFAGLPEDLPAGPTTFSLSNEGRELHELIVVRVNDGVTESLEEILALSEEEAFELVTPLPSVAFAEPGDGDDIVVDLEEGRYFAACFIPVGATGADGPPPEGPPHAMQGMVTEFTVA